MKYDARVDYVKFNAEKPMLPMTGRTERGSRNFKYMVQNEHGRVQWGHNKSDNFQHTLSGANLAYMPLSQQIDMIDLWRSDGATFTRIDLAITVQGDHMNDAYVHAQRAVGALADQRVVKAVSSPDHGYETIYIGDQKKRGRKGIFRAYRHDLAHDYVALYGRESTPHTRLELEFGRSNAQGASNAIVNTRDVHAVMSAYLNFPDWELWQALSNGEIVRYEQRGTAFNDTYNLAGREQWLRDQVAPAFGKLMADQIHAYGAYPIYDEFMRIARKAYYDRINDLIS